MPTRGIDTDTNIINEDEYVNNSIRFKDSAGNMQNVVLNNNEVLARAGGEISKIALSANQIVGRKSSGDIVALDGSDLREILGFTRNHISGLITAPAAFGSGQDIKVNPGECRSEDNTEDMILSSTFLKNYQNNWVEGNEQGALDTGTKEPLTFYYIFLIKNPTTQNVDFIISKSSTSPIMPSGYTKKRLLGAFITDNTGVARLQEYEQFGDYFSLNTSVLIFTDTSITNNTLELVTIPGPTNALLHLIANIQSSGSEDHSLYVNHENSNNVGGNLEKAFFHPGSSSTNITVEGFQLVNEANRIKIGAANAGTVTEFNIVAKGFFLLRRTNP